MLTGALAVVPVRDGEPATGGEEALGEAGGNGVLIGSGAESLAGEFRRRRMGRLLDSLEMATFRPGEWAEVLGPLVGGASVVILPASPDGRDLAPRLAGVLGWPLLAAGIRVTEGGASLTRWQGRQIARCEVEGPFVATLVPGSRSVPEAVDVPEDEPPGETVPPGRPVEAAGAAEPLPVGGAHAGQPGEPAPGAGLVEGRAAAADFGGPNFSGCPEAELVELLPAGPAVVDLRAARRILAGGAGLGGSPEFDLLAHVAAELGASVGATRVVTDAGILPQDRQIGTTGVSVRPRCYVAFGISGAVQHLGGLGSPEHVIAVNLDRSCPMMSMADLAVVADAPAVLRALALRLAAAAVGAE